MAKTKKFRKPSKREMDEDYLKANRKGSREAELENASGWAGKSKVHKSKKEYSRKPKHKGNWDD
jgi:hypothetical protein